MSEEPTPQPCAGLDVRQLARELIAEDIDLEDIYEDRISAPDTRASHGEPVHRAAAVQLPRPRSDPPSDATPEKVVLRHPNFGPMLLPTSTSERAATLAPASPHEATTVSLATRFQAPGPRRPFVYLALLVTLGVGAAAIAHSYLRAPTESSTP